MSEHVPVQLRRLVAERARHRCEYCQIAEADTFFGCEVEHIIARKHGGETVADNLAYACLPCNRHKGTDLVTLLPWNSSLIRLFHPRADRWDDRFRVDGPYIRSLTDVGEATVRLLAMNHPDRVAERQAIADAYRA